MSDQLAPRMKRRRSRDLRKEALYEVAVKQLPQTRSQDNARVFLPGADQKIGGALESICVGGVDVTATLTSLQTTLQAIFDAQVKPRL